MDKYEPVGSHDSDPFRDALYSEPKDLYKIDPNGKYVIYSPAQLTRVDAEAITRAWEEFVTNPNKHVIVIAGNLQLMKIEPPEEAKNG